MAEPPSLEAFEYTDEFGRRWRYVRTTPQVPALPPERPAEAPRGIAAPWWAWAVLACLLALWVAFLLRAWRFSLWWGPLRWPVEVVWVVGWIVTPLWALSACIVGLGEAFRR